MASLVVNAILGYLGAGLVFAIYFAVRGGQRVGGSGASGHVVLSARDRAGGDRAGGDHSGGDHSGGR